MAGLVCAAALLPACDREPPAGAPPGAPGARPASVSPPIDFNQVVRSASLAYRPEGDGWIGRGAAYDVRARAGGFEVAPVRRGAAAGRGEVRGAPLSFATVRMGREERALPGPERARVEADGHLAVGHGPLIEHLRNRDEGVELSYSFPGRPEGTGDLTVRLDVSGERYAGAAGGVHHYQDPATGLGLRFGEATWIDGRGARSSVPVRAVPGGLELRVPGDVVERSAYPAVLDPIISPELTLSNPTYGPAPDDQTRPALAFDGMNYMAVWADQRSGNYDIRGARVAESGTVLDPASFVIATGAAHQSHPGIAFDGTNYLVVWTDPFMFGSPSSQTNVYGARVSPQGVVLDPNGFAISATVDAQGLASVVFDGTSYVVVWTDRRAAPQVGVYAARVSPAGVVLDPAGIPVTAGQTLLAEPAIAFDGMNALVTWVDLRNGDADIYGARVSPAGVVLDPAGLPLAAGAGGQTDPDVAFDGTNYFVTWIDNGVRAARVTPQGAVLDAAPLTISGTDPLGKATAAFDGANTLVLWPAQNVMGYYQAYAARVTPAGAVLDPGGVTITPNHIEVYWPAVARGTASVFALWMQADDSPWDVFGSRLSAQATALDAPGIPVAGALASEHDPSVAFDGQSYVVVWADSRVPSSGVFAARVTPAGVILDPAGIPITTAGFYKNVPIAVFNGTNTVVVWQEYDCCGAGFYRAARLSPQGIVLDPVPADIDFASPFDSIFDAASDGAGTVLVVADDGGIGNNDDIQAVRLDASLAILAPGTVLFPIPGYQLRPSVSFDGASFLMTWGDDRNGGFDLYGARVSPQGVLLDAQGFPISELAAGGALLSQAPSARLGTNSVVVWAEDRLGASSLYAAEVSPQGVVLSPQSIAVSPVTQGFSAQPDVVYDGARALVVWRDGVSASELDIVGSQIEPGGAVQPVFPVTTDPGSEGPPRLASEGNGRSMVVYSRSEGSSPRARARFITESGQGGAGGAGGQMGAGGGQGGAGGGQGGAGNGAGGAGGASASSTGAGGTGTASNGAGGEGGDIRAILDSTSTCDCRAAGAPQGPAPLALLALGAALGVRRRRRWRAPASF